MPPKIIISPHKEGYKGPEKKYRAKPKPYIMSDSLKQYILERDRWFYKNIKDPETIAAIKEKYGIK